MEAEITRQSNASRKRPRAETHRPEHVYPRKRAITACRLCRHRKVKCNNQRPVCGACSASNASCIYEDAEDHSVFDPASLKILERLDEVLRRLDHLPLADGGHSTHRLLYDGGHVQEAVAPVSSTGDEAWIPAARTTVENVLAWPVFGDCSRTDDMLDAIYGAECGITPVATPAARSAGFVDKDIQRLVQRFVEFVHVKNPVVDVETLWSYANQVVEDGIDWTPHSCLVLLACALGSIAQDFSISHSSEVSEVSSSHAAQSDELASGDAYYNLARRRFGLLHKGILAPQCYFLAGVYLMYTLKPVQAWSKLQQASQLFHIYLVCQRRAPVANTSHELPSKRRHLEQRIYWSCYKAECELRAELDLPSGPLATSGYPDMHPTAPDFLFREAESAQNSPEFAESPESVASRRIQMSRPHLEASWYYYLTEITLRRMENEVLRLFYRHHHVDWMDSNIPSMASAAMHIEHQLDMCLEQLPPHLKENKNEELSAMIRGRVFECKGWLYRPSLFYAIHHPAESPNWVVALPFVDKAIATCLEGIILAPSPHRHHGTFFALRTSTANALCIIATARCPNLQGHLDHSWSNQIDVWARRMRYWQGECPGVREAIRLVDEEQKRTFITS